LWPQQKGLPPKQDDGKQVLHLHSSKGFFVGPNCVIRCGGWEDWSQMSQTAKWKCGWAGSCFDLDRFIRPPKHSHPKMFEKLWTKGVPAKPVWDEARFTPMVLDQSSVALWWNETTTDKSIHDFGSHAVVKNRQNKTGSTRHNHCPSVMLHLSFLDYLVTLQIGDFDLVF